MIQLTHLGPITKDENRTLTDLSGRELAALVPLCVLMLWIGVAPDAFLKPSRRRSKGVLADYHAAGSPQPEVAVRRRCGRRLRLSTARATRPAGRESRHDHGGRPMSRRCDWMAAAARDRRSAAAASCAAARRGRPLAAPGVHAPRAAARPLAAALGGLLRDHPGPRLTDAPATFDGLLETSPLTAAFSFVIVLLATGALPARLAGLPAAREASSPASTTRCSSGAPSACC